MQRLPYHIYLNKKIIIIRFALFLSLFLIAVWMLWYNTKQFYDGQIFHPEVLFLSPFVIIGMLFYTIREVRLFDNNEIQITLNHKGIIFYGKYFIEIGVVNWEDIARCVETKEQYETVLNIIVHQPDIYINKIQNKKYRKKVQTYCNENGNVLFWINARLLNCDLTALKRNIFQMIDKTKNTNN